MAGHGLICTIPSMQLSAVGFSVPLAIATCPAGLPEEISANTIADFPPANHTRAQGNDGASRLMRSNVW
jgi:hypothetical protein